MTDPDERAVRLLRETLAERAASVDDAPPALPSVPAQRRPPRAPFLAVAAAALVAVAVVTGVATWRAGNDQRAATTTAPAARAAVPAGWKPVASLGVQIYVPPDWQLAGELNEECALQDPGARLVSRPIGGTTMQLCSAPPKGTLVAFRPAPLEGEEPGRRVLGDGRTQITWVSPRGGAAVVASGADGAVLQQVIDTARPVDVDALGCPTDAERPSWDRPRTGLPPVRMPGGVVAVVGCVYARDRAGTYRLVASNPLDDGQRAALEAALRGAPAGAAPDVPQNCAPGLPEEAYGVLRVRTAAGVSELALHWDGCLNRYVASPDAQSAMTERVLTTVMEALRVGFGWTELPKG